MAEQVELPPGTSKEDAEKFLASLKNEEPPIVFKEIELGPNQQLRVHKTTYKGKEKLSIQKFWREDDTQDWQFGKAVTFTYEDIDDLIEGLTAMKSWCEETPK